MPAVGFCIQIAVLVDHMVQRDEDDGVGFVEFLRQ